MSWVATAIVAGSAITAGAGMYSASQNGGAPGIEQKFTQGPSFDAGQTAQKDWLSQLTSDQNDPTGNFGGISPDWNDIWQQTQKQVQQYYNGGPTSPGVNDQIKASFAQRGMSGDPASSYLLAASGANQASDLNNQASAMNIAKNQFAQTAKQNWFTNMKSFNDSTMPEQGMWSGGVPFATPGQQIGNAIGAAGSGLASYGLQAQGQQNQLDWFKSMTTTPTKFAPSGSFSNTAPYTVPNVAAI